MAERPETKQYWIDQLSPLSPHSAPPSAVSRPCREAASPGPRNAKRWPPEGSFNPQELFLLLPISRKSNFQCCQRDMFRQGSDDRQMNDFRGEKRPSLNTHATKTSNSKKSAENWNGLSREWERPFHKVKFIFFGTQSILVILEFYLDGIFLLSSVAGDDIFLASIRICSPPFP